MVDTDPIPSEAGSDKSSPRLFPDLNYVSHDIDRAATEDMIAGYRRILGYDPIVICGTDEYDTATATKSPKEICDKYHGIRSNVYQLGRTSTLEQMEVWPKMMENNRFSKNTMQQVMYPSTCIGMFENGTLMKTISSVEHLNNEDGKFFKSKVAGVFKIGAEDTIASEEVREYYTQTNRPEGVLMVGGGADGVARHLSYKEHTWKRNDALSKAEDQGVYPICWVISVTEVLEAVHLIEHQELVQLSRQQLLDGCASKTLAYDSPLHCLFDWIKRNGLVSASKYPWTGKKASLKKIEPEFTLEGYEIVSIRDEDDIKRRLYERPLCIVILVSVQLKTLEKGKIYHVTKQEYDPYLASCKRLQRPIMYHSLVLTGWNEIGGIPVWEALNSYGDKYCDDGYFYFVRGSAINEDLEYNPLLQVLDVKGLKKAEK